MIWFIVGLFVGTWVGIMITAIMVDSGRRERAAARQLAQHHQAERHDNNA